MFCIFVFTAICKADRCCRTQGLFGEESNDSTADVIKVLASSTMSSSLCPMSCPPELTKLPSVLKKTKSSTVQTGGALKERAESHRLLLQYVLQSDLIKLLETQQQQQYQPYHRCHPSHQQPFVTHDMQFQQPLSTNQHAPKFQHIPFHHSIPVKLVSITEVRPAVSHQHLVTALASNICTVTTFASSTATSGGIFDPSLMLSSLIELQPVTALTPSTSFMSDENVNLNTPQLNCTSDKGMSSSHLLSSHFIGSFSGPTKSSTNELNNLGGRYQCRVLIPPPNQNIYINSKSKKYNF